MKRAAWLALLALPSAGCGNDSDAKDSGGSGTVIFASGGNASAGTSSTAGKTGTSGGSTSTGSGSSGGASSSSGGSNPTTGGSSSAGGSSPGGSSSAGSSSSGGSSSGGGSSNPNCSLELAFTPCSGSDHCEWTNQQLCVQGYCNCTNGNWACAQTMLGNCGAECPEAIETSCGDSCTDAVQGCLCRCGGGFNYSSCSCNGESWDCLGC